MGETNPFLESQMDGAIESYQYNVAMTRIKIKIVLEEYRPYVTAPFIRNPNFSGRYIARY